MSLDIQWVLNSRGGMEYILPQTMIFLGREECDVTLQSRSVDKRHAVITYDHYEKCFKVKDLNSTNGTYVNDTRIPGQTYMKLEHMDSIRFGYDPNEFKIQRMHRTGLAAEITLSKRLSPEGIDGKDSVSSQPYSEQQQQLLQSRDCKFEDTLDESAVPQNASNLVNSPVMFGNRGVAQSETTVLNSTNTNQSNNHKGYSGNSLCHQNRPPVESGETIPSVEAVCSSREVLSSLYSVNASNGGSGGGSVVAGLDVKLDSSEGSPQVPILCSAKHILESTSSNASLHSAFSGDSLDQLNESTTSGVGSDQTLEGVGNCSSLSTSVLSASEGDQVTTKVSTNDEGRSEKSFSLSKGSREECIFQDISSAHLPPTQPSASDPSKSATVDEENSKEKQKALATAFTIEFDSVKTSSRKLDIKDSISKFAPPKTENDRPPPGHRRNLSLSKVDEQKTSFEKKPASCETSPHTENILYGICKSVHTVKRGYHSEGYFSSDQDDDMSAKSERFSMRTAKCIEKSKGRSTENGNVNSSAAFLINKMLSSNEQEASSSKPPLASTFKHLKNSSSVQPPNRCEESSGDGNKTVNRPSILNVKSSILEDIDFLALSVQAELNHRNRKLSNSDDAKDNVSETGTYTIEKESPNLELEEARRNIDRIFGVTLEEPEEAVISGPQIFPLNVRDMQGSPDSDSSKSKSDSIPKRGTPNLTKDWSMYERQHTSSPFSDKEIHYKGDKQAFDESEINSQGSGSRLSKTTSPENLQRPRRKLPTPPVDKLPFSIAACRNNDSGQSETSFFTCSEGLQNSANQSLSDMSYDTEKLLKETETVVTAMEARMDHAKAVIRPTGSLESRDSGGESDIDTSTASYCADKKSHKQESNLSKRLNNQLKAKYKAMDESRRSPPTVIDKRLTKSTGGSTKGQTKSRNIVLNQDHAGSDNVSECETASIASDISSSSDISGSSPHTRRRNSEKVPPAMKFNRAFSLRRARLGYSSDSASEKPLPSPLVPQNAKSRNAESKRTETNKCRPSSSSPSISLNRNDGGRFSLRMGKVAKSTSSGGVGRKEEPSKMHKSSGKSGRSNSTMTAKEAEMKNWRRRKEYDPMKAAAEGRKKEAAKRVVDKEPTGQINSPAANFQRSASFHGTEGFHNMHRNAYTSEDDMTRSLEEEEIIKCTTEFKHGHMETIISREQSLSSSPQRKKSNFVDDYSPDGYSQSPQADILRGSPPYIRSNQMNSHRNKTKMEALDSLVITTIHQMSTKLCGHTENLIKKLKDQYKVSAEKAESLEDLLELLGSPDTPTSPATRNMSRELAGILKNLKKLEKGLQAIDKLSREEMVATDCSCPSNKQNCNGLSD